MRINGVPNSVIKIIAELNNNGYEGYLVGGCVRDGLIQRVPSDWDICTNAKPDDMLRIFRDWNHYDVGLKYGTITLVCKDGNFEVTTYRTDGEYSDNRRPDDVKFVTSLEDDLARRDFTINAMAYNPLTDELIDKFDGLKHLIRGELVAVGDADKRFKEDALRILRALRFAINYGLEINNDNLEAMRSNVKLINNVSKERITSELEKILTSGKPITRYFKECSWLIAEIIPELRCCFNFKQNNKYHKNDVWTHMLTTVDSLKSNKFELKLAALLHDIGKPDSYTEVNGEGHFYGHPKVSADISYDVLKNRLKLTSEQFDLTLKLIEYHDMYITSRKNSVKKRLNKFGEAFISDWLILKEADMTDHIYDKSSVKNVTNVKEIEELLNGIIADGECFSLRDLDIDGYILIRCFGLKQGKQIGIILNHLLNDVIEGKVENKQEDLMRRLSDLIEQEAFGELEFRGGNKDFIAKINKEKQNEKRVYKGTILKTDEGTLLIGAIQSSNGASFDAEGCYKYCNQEGKSDYYNLHSSRKLKGCSTLLNHEKQSEDWYKSRNNFIDTEFKG